MMLRHLLSLPDDGKQILIYLTFRFAIAGLIAFGLFLASFQYFVLTLPASTLSKTPIVAKQKPAGLVVITGGQARIRTGLSLLIIGPYEKMLVSGVGRGVSKEMLTRSLALTRAQSIKLRCCVDLDFKAQNTKGNVLSAKDWLENHGFDQLHLVTANYHLPRSKLEFERVFAPEQLSYIAVSPPDLDLNRWYADWPSLKLLSREFGKYLWVRAGL